jgi:hypothetical protein
MNNFLGGNRDSNYVIGPSERSRVDSLDRWAALEAPQVRAQYDCEQSNDVTQA